MEDYYEKYIEKAQYIDQACNCIDENSASKLNDGISEIKNVISKLSIDDNWQDKAGSAFKKMIKNCIKNLEKIETSISTDFSNSEKIYKLLKLRLEQLQDANKLYNNYSREPIQSSYKKKVAKTVNGTVTDVYVDDVDTFNSEHAKWQDLQTKCIDLSEEIDDYFKQLDEINENGNIFMLDTLFKFDVSVKRFTDSVGKGGNFVSNNLDNTKQGFFVSDKDGRKYTIYDQTKIDGWGEFCNRAAAASIASGFASNGQNPITVANNISSDKNYKPELGYDQKTTSAYFEKFGLSATVDKVDCSYDLVKDKILSALKNGDKVMFDLSEEGVVGDSGQQWTSKRHWLSVLDIKKTGPGENDYAIFVSDSGHGGSTVDRKGYGEGWYSIDEFMGKKVANVTTVQQKNNASTASTQATPTSSTSSFSMDKSQTISGTDVEADIYKAVKDMGYNDAVAAALIANVDAESNFKTTVVGDNGTSLGLYQWHNDRRTSFLNYCKENNLDSSSAYVQTKYALLEVQNNSRFKSVYETLKTAPDTKSGYEEASKIWTIKFEVPTNKDQKAISRAKNGEKYYENIKKLNNDSPIKV